MVTKKLRSVDDSAASVKKPRFSLPDPEEMMKSSSRSRSLLKSMTRCCKDFVITVYAISKGKHIIAVL